VVVPLQDILGLGSEARINGPGTPQGNWQWRCTRSDWDRIERESAAYLNELVRIFDRCGGSEVS
jgi:4-alpha-glucanotransferase